MPSTTAARTATRILVVADWTVDAQAVIDACRMRAAQGDASFTLVVPAWLHGLDWVGDPAASAPCAQRQVEALTELGARAGLDVEAAIVGDPDVLSAIGDALHERAAGAIMLFERSRRTRPATPFDLAHRARRLTGLPVERFAVAPNAGPRGRRCDADAPRGRTFRRDASSTPWPEQSGLATMTAWSTMHDVALLYPASP